MRRSPSLFLLGLAVILCVGGEKISAQEPHYEIEDYTATLTIRQATADVDVQLDITYHVLEGTKSDGFKYVGTYEPVNLRGADEAGQPIRVSLRRHRENQIYWTFPPVHGGERKRLVIQYTLRNVLTGTRAANTLSAPWVGIFKVPVRQAVYHIVFPPGIDPGIQRMIPGDYSRTTDFEGRVVLEVRQSPLTQRELLVQFAPGVVTGQPSYQPSSGYQPSSQAGTDAFGGMLGLFTIGIIIAAVIGMLNYNKRKTGRWLPSGSGSGGCGFGGCGGGGCGGGGCGGGCGG